MLCSRPSIPSNAYIVHPATTQDHHVHGTRLFLACRSGHFLIGTPIMTCNQTGWIQTEFNCIGKYGRETRYVKSRLRVKDLKYYLIPGNQENNIATRCVCAKLHFSVGFSRLFFWLPLFLPPFAVPSRIALGSPFDRVILWPYHLNLC